jgi:hypothetical protein
LTTKLILLAVPVNKGDRDRTTCTVVGGPRDCENLSFHVNRLNRRHQRERNPS